MSRAMLKRLESLEQKTARHDGKYHLVFGHSLEELEAGEQDLKASPEWREGDSTIAVHFVSPGDVAVQGLSG
jgi:hypothetical protein